MPELPDIAVYIDALRIRTLDRTLAEVRLKSHFLLRTVDPPLAAVFGKAVRGIERMGKRIAVALEDDLFLVLHLMVSGRLRWSKKGAGIPGRVGLAAFDFQDGTLLMTEASTKKRASLHVIQGRAALEAFRPAGIEILEASHVQFKRQLLLENRTLKRALTDQRLFSGIGNAYSDEILFCAELSPMRLTSRLTTAEIKRLYKASQKTLEDWIARLKKETGNSFPEKVTAFHDKMAVHGRYRKPCPTCGAPIQRIRYAENECNYCATCQNQGNLLADRALSRLLKKDWPKTLDELESRRGGKG
ncbi:MAG: DNA-formamidopyrimidine glycosylase family protein [Myxococcota bacterium]|nr:DNA-formamidopyrimidine glycosylase family protein [Myxococcota bacterium]